MKTNEQTNRDLTEAQSNIANLQSCHGEMMQKIQLLQDANDELTIQLEGFKVQCDNALECSAKVITAVS